MPSLSQHKDQRGKPDAKEGKVKAVGHPFEKAVQRDFPLHGEHAYN